MTTMTATPALLSRHEAMRKTGIAAFTKGANYPPRLKKPKKGLPPRQPLLDNKPTPERIKHAVEVRQTSAPPFHYEIVGNVSRFQKQLGPDMTRVLGEFYEVAMTAQTSKGQTASYSGMSVDQSMTDYQHLTESQRMASELFHRVWSNLGEPFRRLAKELLLEQAVVGERPRDAVAAGRELCNYANDQSCRAAAVTALRLLGWRITELMGGRVPVRA